MSKWDDNVVGLVDLWPQLVFTTRVMICVFKNVSSVSAFQKSDFEGPCRMSRHRRLHFQCFSAHIGWWWRQSVLSTLSAPHSFISVTISEVRGQSRGYSSLARTHNRAIIETFLWWRQRKSEARWKEKKKKRNIDGNRNASLSSDSRPSTSSPSYTLCDWSILSGCREEEFSVCSHVYGDIFQRFRSDVRATACRKMPVKVPRKQEWGSP